MPAPYQDRNIGAYAIAVAAIAPQAASAAVNGITIDRAAHGMPKTCLLHQNVGAATGAPTAISAVTKLQHSPDGTTWADYTDPDSDVVAATAPVTAVNTDSAVSVNLSAADQYIRAVGTPTLTGGTSPTLLIAATATLAGAQVLPPS